MIITIEHTDAHPVYIVTCGFERITVPTLHDALQAVANHCIDLGFVAEVDVDILQLTP